VISHECYLSIGSRSVMINLVLGKTWRIKCGTSTLGSVR
jgi:hypothetical protein